MYIQTMVDLIQLNFLPVVATLFMGFFLVINKKYEPTLTALFKAMFFLLIVLIITDNTDYYMYDAGSTYILHQAIAVIGFNVRILILLRLVTIMDHNITGRIRKVAVLPMVLNFCILMLSFKTHLVFWYDESGVYQRGPLGYSSHIAMAAYLIYGIFLARAASRKGQKNECYIIAIEEILCVFGTLAELNYNVRGILIGVIALNITFYYLYLHICKFYTDPLTGALNRASFYADMQQYAAKITAIYSIDLNGLKQANDTQGHQAGDALLKNTTTLLQKALLPHCYLYRTGGDEFVILCIGLGRMQIGQMTSRLFDAQKKGCNFAFGMSELVENPHKTFKLADDAMYLNKCNMKARRAQ